MLNHTKGTLLRLDRAQLPTYLTLTNHGLLGPFWLILRPSVRGFPTHGALTTKTKL